jgi:hypothetical protein
MSATTTQLLSSGEFCKLRYDAIPVKSAPADVSFYTNNSKCQFLSSDTLLANEIYIYIKKLLNYITNAPTCFCDSAPSSGSFGIVFAEVIQY